MANSMYISLLKLPGAFEDLVDAIRSGFGEFGLEAPCVYLNEEDRETTNLVDVFQT